MEVHDGQVNLKIWGVTADGDELVSNGDFTPGADLVLNGDFATDTDWTKGTGWTIAGDVANSDASQTGDSDLTQTPATALIPGEAYEIVFTVANRSAGNVTAVIGDQEGTDRATNATFTEQIVCGAGADIDLRADVDFDGDVSVVSCTQVGDATWTLGTGWAISGGLATSDASQVGDSDLTMTPVEALIETNIYEVTMTVSGRTAGNVTPVVGETEGTDRATNAEFVEEIAAGSGADIDIRADVDFDGSVEVISIVRKFIGWDSASVAVEVLAEDGVTWLTAATKTADFIGSIDLGSSSNEVVRATMSSTGNQTKVSCSSSRG
jgi:hypothetical protein